MATPEATGSRHWVSIRTVLPRRMTGFACRQKRWKSIILAGRFAGRGGAPVRYQAHRPMEGDQGYSGSHDWLPPPGKYCGQ